MKVGDEIKICFLPIGTVFESVEYGRGTLNSSTHEYGSTPGHVSNGWYGHPYFRWVIVWSERAIGKPKSLSTRVKILSLPQTNQFESQEDQPKRSSNVERNIAALMREDAKTIEVAFNGGSKTYTYITSLDINPGDHAVVDCGNNGFKVVQVLEVHDDVEIEPNSDTKFKWVVAKFDLEHHKSNEAKNEQIEKLMATGYRANIRRHFAANMMACLSDEKKAELTAIVSGEQVIDVQPERRTRKKS